jgi:hypothetical protein
MSRRLLPYALVVLGWVVLQACLAAWQPSPVFDGRLIDSDSYMRLVRVGTLMDGDGWYDGTIARSNAPHGETLHWTRPFDLLLVAGATLLAPFLGAKAGLFWAGALVSPVLQLAAAFAFIWAMTPLVRPNRWLLSAMALVAVFLQPAVLSGFNLGHADHHSLLLLVFVATSGCLLRALAWPDDLAAAGAGGALAGFGVWLAPEFLVTTAVCLAVLAFSWVLGGGRRTAQNLVFAMGFAGLVATGLIAEQPLARLGEIAHDRISILHAALAGIVLIYWLAAALLERRTARPATPPGRALALVAYGAAAGLALIVADPLFLAGPLAAVDPRIAGIWLDHVVEMAPVLPDSIAGAGRFAFYFGLGLFAFPFLLWTVLGKRRAPAWLGWCFLLLAIAVFWPLAVAHVRFAPYAELLLAMAATGLAERLIARTATMSGEVRRGLIRAFCLYAMILGPVAIGRLLMDWPADGKDATEQQTAQDVCDLPTMAAYLETSPAWPADEPRTILAFLDLGPELLYRTRHRVIATPYHRNGDGIFDSRQMLIQTDDATARALMAGRGVDLVLLCPASPERVFFTDGTTDDGLYDRLIRGDGPDWLSEIVLPTDLASGFRLFEVRAAAGG